MCIRDSLFSTRARSTPAWVGHSSRVQTQIMCPSEILCRRAPAPWSPYLGSYEVVPFARLAEPAPPIPQRRASFSAHHQAGFGLLQWQPSAAGSSLDLYPEEDLIEPVPNP